MTPAAHREAMLRLAIDGEPRFVLERCELQPRRPELHDGHACANCRRATPGADWFLIIGQDQYARPAHLARLATNWCSACTLAVARGRAQLAAGRRRGAAAAAGRRGHAADADISTTDIRRVWPPAQDISAHGARRGGALY